MTMTLPRSIFFCEVGPRDGLQNEPDTLSVQRKIRLIEGVVDAGVKIVEIGSYVHPKAVPQMADTDEVACGIRRVEGVEYRALVANLKGVERAIASGVNKVKLTVSASESHAKANLNKTPSELIEGFKSCIEFAHSNGAEVSGAISTAFGCPFEGKVPPGQVAEIANGCATSASPNFPSRIPPAWRTRGRFTISRPACRRLSPTSDGFSTSTILAEWPSRTRSPDSRPA